MAGIYLKRRFGTKPVSIQVEPALKDGLQALAIRLDQESDTADDLCKCCAKSASTSKLNLTDLNCRGYETDRKIGVDTHTTTISSPLRVQKDLPKEALKEVYQRFEEIEQNIATQFSGIRRRLEIQEKLRKTGYFD